MNSLSPSQAADVIRYYHNGENADARAKGWGDKVSLGQSAIHATSTNHSLLPSDKPLLTDKEMYEGIQYIDGSHTTPAWPVEPSAEQWQEIERLVDTQPCSYDDAYRQIMGIHGPSS